MSRRSLGLLALACGGLACPRSGPSVEPPSEGTVAAPAESTGSGSGSGSGAAEPVLDQLAPWMRPLFDPTSRRTYVWAYAVDVHDTEGSVAEANGVLRCRSDGPTRLALGDDAVALVSCPACELTPGKGEGSFEPDFDDCYLGTAAGLWLVDAPPRDEAEVRQIIAMPPYLPASPEPRNVTEPAEDDGIEHETWTRVAEKPLQPLGRPVTAWCRDDGHSQMYGENITRCFAPGFGLVSLEWDGRSGPSNEAYRVVEIDPLPVQ